MITINKNKHKIHNTWRTVWEENGVRHEAGTDWETAQKIHLYLARRGINVKSELV